MGAIPTYLRPPTTDGVTYGRVTYSDGYFEISDASPAAMVCAKRVLPGSSGRKVLRFPANRRAVGDLNWLMTRWPMVVECQKEFDRHLKEAVDHASRRTINSQPIEIEEQPTEFIGKLEDFQSQGVSFAPLRGRGS